MVVERTQGSNRRKFLGAAARHALLGVLGFTAGKIALKRRRLSREGKCTNRGMCSQCGVFTECGLPAARLARDFLKEAGNGKDRR